MRQHLVTVCIVCILCATHTPCSAHQKDMSPTEPSPLDMGSKGTVHTHRQPERTERDHEEEWDSTVSNKTHNFLKLENISPANHFSQLKQKFSFCFRFLFRKCF